MKRLLIIEDEKPIRDLYAAILDGRYELQFAVDGQEGFRRAMTEPFDLVIADLAMANWNGAEAVSAVNLVGSDVKFVIVSAYLQDHNFLTLLEDVPNIVARIPKPFDTDALLAAIEQNVAEADPV